MSLKVALVSRRYPPLIGGAERVMSYLAAALADQGVDVTVLAARPLEAGGPIPAPEPVEVVRLPTVRTRVVGTLLYLNALTGWLLRHAVDLIYVSMLKHDAYAAIGAGDRRRTPVVLRPEGAGATGDLAWQSWGRFGRAIGRRCLRADAVVAISPAIRAELLTAGYDPDKVHDLPNGVPVPPPWIERGTAGGLRAATVGRLAPEKGLDVLLRAWAKVAQSRPGSLLSLIGDGPARAHLEPLALALGVAGSVHFVGALADPVDALRAQDLFVLPSREEGMSIALLEAMALGIPAVASDIPGNRNLIDPDVHGLLVPPDDPEALATALLAAAADPERHARAGRARARVVEHYSIAAMARRHIQLFEQVLSKQGS